MIDTRGRPFLLVALALLLGLGLLGLSTGDLGLFAPGSIRELSIQQAARFTEQQNKLNLEMYTGQHRDWLRNLELRKVKGLPAQPEPVRPFIFLAAWSDALGETVAGYTPERVPHIEHPPDPVKPEVVSQPGPPWGSRQDLRVVLPGDESPPGVRVQFEGATWERYDSPGPFGPTRLWRKPT